MLKLRGVVLPDHIRPVADPDHLEALELFNLMAGLDWSALPLLFALRDVEDPELMVIRLAIIREQMNKPTHNETKKHGRSTV